VTGSPIRSIVAVLGGAVIVRLLGQALEAGLVQATSDVATIEAYFEARNRLPILVGVVVTHGIGGVLAGYVAAKLAQRAELAHVAFAAALQVALSAHEFTYGGNPGMYPFWVQVALPLVTVPAMLAGAMVRARARMLQETT
jgi:hypothetical protein